MVHSRYGPHHRHRLLVYSEHLYGLSTPSDVASYRMVGTREIIVFLDSSTRHHKHGFRTVGAFSSGILKTFDSLL